MERNGTNLFAAHEQWCKRPPDERFWNLDELIAATQSWKDSSVVGNCRLKQCQFIGEGEEVYLQGSTGKKSRLGHYAFGQLASDLQDGPGANYLRKLPASLAAILMNIHLSASRDRNMALLLQKPNGRVVEESSGDYFCRAALTEQYNRIWNCELATRINDIVKGHNWRTPPARPAHNDPRARPATKADLCASSWVREGNMIAPAGLYASEKDCFMFLLNENNPVTMPGSKSALYRGCFVENSEVGDSRLNITAFMYSSVCGNHIVWDVPWVQKLSVVHKGDADLECFRFLEKDFTAFANSSSEKDNQFVRSASTKLLGNTPQDVVAELWKQRLVGITKGELEDAVATSIEHEEDRGEKVSPFSVWGVAQGVTRLSQNSKYTDRRVVLDKAAGKIMQMAF